MAVGSKKKRAVKKEDKVCRYCMEALAETVDHVIPLALGGSNNYLNLVGCCVPCNARKEDKTPSEAGMVLHVPIRFFRGGFPGKRMPKSVWLDSLKAA